MRVGLAAVVTVVCMFGLMVAAQAAGANVFGAIARWTEEVFSFGKIRDDGATDDFSDDGGDFWENSQSSNQIDETKYKSVKEALDAYGITEVTVPSLDTYGYSLDRISVTSIKELDVFTLSASYESSCGDYLSVEIMRYTDEPGAQVEKIDTNVETFKINGFTVSLIKNSTNYTLAWFTEHYECYISGPEHNVLMEIANSMFD